MSDDEGIDRNGSDGDVMMALDGDASKGKKKKGDKKGAKGGFQMMGLSPAIFRAIMKRGYRVPTPIQRKCIPAILSGQDLVAMARTGSGKTAAFLIPIMEKLREHSTLVGVRAVILSPTRELALQTSKYARELGKFTDLRHCLLLGGDSMEQQFEALSCNPDMIIATPGRLCHVAKTTGLSLKSTEFAVFDEADRLFEMGFAQQLRSILGLMSDTRQTLLLSATMPRALADFTQAGLNSPQVIRLDTEAKISSALQSHFLALRPDQKLGAFVYLLRNTIPDTESTIVFVATRHHVEFINRLLIDQGFLSTMIYGTMDSSARKINLGKFRAGKCKILVVTDVAARGLDLPLLDNVVNYHFPSTPKLFVHRVGRVARAGRSGRAFSLIEPAEMPYVLDLCLFLGTGVPLTAHSTSDAPVAEPAAIVSEDDAPAVERSWLGTLPSTPVDEQSESCRQQVSHTNDLISLERVCGRAYKLYCKTKSGAAPSSVRKAKEAEFCFRSMLPHPIFKVEMNDEDQKHESLMAGLRSFKARGTVFEIGKQDAVMKEKRAEHGVRIEKYRSNHEGEQITRQSFRDDENFISRGSSAEQLAMESGLSVQNDMLGPNRPTRITDLLLEVDGDDAETMKTMKNIRRWDQKKKKFVRLGQAMDEEREARNEAGAKIKGVKGAAAAAKTASNDPYAKWCNKNNKSIPQAGSSEQSTGEQRRGLVNQPGGRFAHRAPGSVPPAAGASGVNANGKRPRSELKGAQQIRKERSKKAKISERAKGGKKGGGGGGNKGHSSKKRR